MPQLVFSTYPAQIFWLIITFSVLYVILSRKILPNIREVLQNRQVRIANDLKKAELLKEEAEAAAADFTSALGDARKKAQELVLKARAQADGEAVRRHAKLDENFERQSKEAELRLAGVRQEAMEKLLPVAVEFAADIAEKVGVKLPAQKIETAMASEVKKKAA